MSFGSRNVPESRAARRHRRGGSVSGAKSLIKKLKRMPEEVTKDLKVVIRREADHIYADAWQYAPYDYDSNLVTPKWEKIGLQGGESRKHLKDALRVSITLKGLRARIGIIGPKAAAAYGLIAKWVHFGTRQSHKKNPFLFNAYKFRLPQSRANIRMAIQDALRRVSGMRFPDA